MHIYQVMDEQAEMPVYAIRGPVGWTLESEVQWNLDNNVVPVIIGAALTDPEETKRLQFFPGQANINHDDLLRLPPAWHVPQRHIAGLDAEWPFASSNLANPLFVRCAEIRIGRFHLCDGEQFFPVGTRELRHVIRGWVRRGQRRHSPPPGTGPPWYRRNCADRACAPATHAAARS